MMPMYNIVVGIRTYNVSSYIVDCLNSVYNLTIKDSIKVVLVDDCSTDNTLVVINKWLNAHLDFALDVYTNFENKGAGVMFMLLLNYIKDCEYVIFLDGDDFYIKNDCLEYMYNFIKNHQFDFVRFSIASQDHHTKILMSYFLFSLIKFNPFRVAEDHYYWLLLLMTSNYVLHDYDFYYYRNNINSLVRKNFVTNYLSKVFDDVYYLGVPESSKLLSHIVPEVLDVLIYNLLSSIEYSIYPAVLVLTRNTDLSEFIDHYYKLGFLLIFILDNNDIPILYDNVHIIPYNNVLLVNFPEFQSTAYDYALRIIRSTKYNYVLVVDDDEYLDLKVHSNITDFLNDIVLSNGNYNCDFLWETYDDNDIIYESDCKQSILSTYTRKLLKGKSSDLNGDVWTKPLYRLFPYIDYSKSLNPGHNPTELVYKRNVISSDLAVLKHYRTLCLETFLKSKVLLKNFVKGVFGSNGLLTSYFCINRCTLDKLFAYKQLCEDYGISYDIDEYNKYLDVCFNLLKLSIIIPVVNIDEVLLVNLMIFPDDYHVLLVSHIFLDCDFKYEYVCCGCNIYDCLSYVIRNLESDYACILFPNSMVYLDKFSKLLEYLKSNVDVDLVTCNCIYNGLLNIKPIISTIMFRVDSLKGLDLLFEDYYQSYDKFFINIRSLNIKNIDEVLLEECINQSPCLYNPHNLFRSNNTKLISVIITFLNEGIEVLKTIESIRSTTTDVPIILIDDCSTDGYNYELLSKVYNCRYIRNSSNLGVAKSRDLGISFCKTEYFVLLDAHMRFYDLDWDLRLYSILLDHPNSIICSNTSSIRLYKDLGYETELKFCTSTFCGYISFSDKFVYDYKWSFNCLDDSELTRVSCIYGACYASSKSHWLNICGLLGLVKYGCDELLLSIKTWLSGGLCLLLKDFYVGHLYRNRSPYYVTDDHVISNKIFLSYFFDYGIDILKQSIDALTYNRCFNMIDFNLVNELRLDFRLNVLKYPFTYFLSINDLIINKKG